MCRKAICGKCQKFTWEGERIPSHGSIDENLVGCGQHKDAVLRNIPMKDRCTCKGKGERAKQQQHWANQSYLR